MTATQDDATLLLDHPIGAHGRFVLRLASADVRLVAETGERATVRTPSGRGLPDRVVLEAIEGGVTIRENEVLGLDFGSGRKTVRLEVALPPETEVVVDTASGEIDARGLHGEQRYRTASGELRLIDGAGRIDVNAVSGDTTLELSGATDLSIRTVSGDVRVAGGSLGTVRVATTSGDIELDSPLTGGTGNTIETLSGDVSLVAAVGLRVEARTVSGDLSSSLPHRSEGSLGRRTLIVGDGSVDVSFRSVSGDLRIHDGTDRRHQASAGPSTGSGAMTATGPGVPPIPPLPGIPAVPAIPPLPPLPGHAPGSSTISRVGDDPDGPAASREDPQEASGAGPDDSAEDEERLAILRSLERGELDVATAMARLADLDARAVESTDAPEEPTDV